MDSKFVRFQHKLKTFRLGNYSTTAHRDYLLFCAIEVLLLTHVRKTAAKTILFGVIFRRATHAIGTGEGLDYYRWCGVRQQRIARLQNQASFIVKTHHIAANASRNESNPTATVLQLLSVTLRIKSAEPESNV